MMRPDFVILGKRIKDTATRFYRESEHSDSLNYATFFPDLERNLEELFSEQGLVLSYKGRTGRVFPATLFWGTEYDFGGNIFAKRGEIDVLFQNEKIGSLFLEFKMMRGSVKLIEPPKLTLSMH